MPVGRAAPDPVVKGKDAGCTGAAGLSVRSFLVMWLLCDKNEAIPKLQYQGSEEGNKREKGGYNKIGTRFERVSFTNADLGKFKISTVIFLG